MYLGIYMACCDFLRNISGNQNESIIKRFLPKYFKFCEYLKCNNIFFKFNYSEIDALYFNSFIQQKIILSSIAVILLLF